MTNPGEHSAAVEGSPQPGDIFADKYRIERVLGVGGMGYVLAAVHVHLDERVAIKMLLPALAHDGDTVGRFLREGRAAVKIRSEHVGKVLDVGSWHGTHFIVMEYLDGCDLAQLLQRGGRLAVPRAVDFILQACEAIAEAHALRTVHRDLKPANLFLILRPDGSECIKVLDFGISKTTGPEGGAQLSMTRTSTMMGSPLYMSPEQLKSSKHVDERADIWALGVILFELVAGRPPFIAETLAELGALVLSGEPPDLRAYAPETPAGLVGVVSTCLRRSNVDRFPSIAELAAALQPFGTEAARRSTSRITQVLERVPRPPNSGAYAAISASALPFTPSGSTTDPGGATLVDTGRVGAQTGGTWGSSSAPGTATRSRRGLALAASTFVVVAAVAGGLLFARARHAAPEAVPESQANTNPPLALAIAQAAPSAPLPAPVSSAPPVAVASSVASNPTSAPVPHRNHPKSPTAAASSAPVPITQPAKPAGDFSNSRTE